jgi:hypothetical protein
VGCVSFDGASGNINCGSAAALDNIRTLSISAWIKPASVGEGGFGHWLNKNDGTNGWQAYVQVSGGDYTVRFLQRWSVQFGIWYSTVQTLNTWIHAAVTYDGNSTANDAQIYINGAAVTTTRFTIPSGTITDDAALDFLIGNRPADDRTFDGLIAHATVHNVILSANEISVLPQRPMGIARGWVGGWPLVDSSPHQDWSGQKNVGTATGTAASTDSPPVSI